MKQTVMRLVAAAWKMLEKTQRTGAQRCACLHETLFHGEISEGFVEQDVNGEGLLLMASPSHREYMVACGLTCWAAAQAGGRSEDERAVAYRVECHA